MEGSLEDALKQWNSYHSALQKVTQISTETEYALHRYSTATGDIHAFTDQIKQLKGEIISVPITCASIKSNDAINYAFLCDGS